VLAGMAALKEVRVLVLSDHPTPISIRTHAVDPSPFVVYPARTGEAHRSGMAFSEEAAAATGLLISPGHQLMDRFIGKGQGFFA